MTANERRAEIMRILVARRTISMSALANELGVSRRTICTDIQTLTLENPIDATMGRNGGVSVPDWYHPHRNILTMEQEDVISQLMETANEQQRKALREMLLEYGSPKYRQTAKEATIEK